jgi:hypothetical protein
MNVDMGALDAYGAGARTWLWRDFGNCAGIKT